MNAPAPFSGAAIAAGYVEGEETVQRPSPPHSFDVVSEPKTSSEAEESASDRGSSYHLTEPPAMRPSPPKGTEPLEDLSRLGNVETPRVAARGLRGALARIGFPLQPGAAEQRSIQAEEDLRRDETTIRQATWTRAVSVLVANRKGGTGKTPTSIVLGGALAAIRGGSVAIIEVSDDPGTLTFRAEGSPQLGIGELVRDVDQIRSAGQLAGYTAPQTSFASVLGTVGPRPQLNRSDIERVAAVVDSYYAIRVMDSGNQPSSSAFEGAVATADVLVVPVLNSADVVLEAIAMLEHMRAAGGHSAHLANAAIVVRLTDGRPEHPQVVDRLTQLIESANVAQVFHVPYDRHIAERGQISLAQLSPATRAALTALAAGVVRALRSVPMNIDR